METSVHVILTGIILLIPLKEGGVRAVLLDASEGKAPVPHVATLLAEQSTVTKGLPTGVINHRTKGPLSFWELKKERILVRSRILDENKPVVPRDFVPHLPETGKERAKKVKKVFADPNGDSQVAAVLDMEKGKLTSSWVNPDFEWRFLPLDHHGAPGPTMFLAQEVCWTFEIDGEELQLEINPMGKIFGNKTLKTKKNELGLIEVRLGNTTRDDIAPGGDPPEPHTDYHFLMYYTMTEDLPDYQQSRIPHPVQTREPLKDPLNGHQKHKLNFAGEVVTKDGIRVRSVGGSNCPPSGGGGGGR